MDKIGIVVAMQEEREAIEKRIGGEKWTLST